ncbi:unnamed protein product [Clonostachys rhizophaga]|uniref:Heterokaryon incompatibility domain-containing protein n=1 Tax=Clonostachys rhizophaga TaxID=160324 RepID=A0A9N9V8V7_9HYPO|nr:unnamed protein product [Clonostachys rhizophaga]
MTQELERPLDFHSQQFRLFTLSPSDDIDSPIEGSIQRTDFNDATPFEVLSYVRESSKLMNLIYIDQEAVLVPANVGAALRRLRYHNEPRHLWVDFICVDQRSLSERSFYIRFMKTILRKCVRVLVWLGPNLTPPGEPSTASEEDVGKGLQLMERICNKDPSLLQDLELYGLELYRPYRAAGGITDPELEAKVDLHVTRLVTMEQQQDLENALQTPPAWKDLWTIRDICLAPQVHLFAGSHVVDWAKIEDFLGDVSYAKTIYGQDYIWGKVWILSLMMKMVAKIYHQRQTMRNVLAGSVVQSEQSLLAVMEQFRFVETADSRDLIHSMINLATDMDDFKIDYGDSPGRLFSNLTELLINRDENLYVISQGPWRSFSAPTLHYGYGYSISSPTGEKPSWVANFQKNSIEYGRLFPDNCPYKSGRPSCEVPIRVIDGKVLVAKGVKLGRVGKIKQSDYDYQKGMEWINPEGGPRAMRKDSLPMEYLDLYLDRAVLTESDATAQEYVTGESCIRAFWRTLVMDCNSHPTIRLSAQQIESEDAIVRAEWSRRILDMETHGSGSVKEPCFSDRKINELWDDVYFNWTFSMTENGLYVMLAPPAREGDIIACLDGCQMPLVLRPTEGVKEHLEIVTYAYVHGFMDGEATNSLVLQEKLRLQEQEIWFIAESDLIWDYEFGGG